MPGECASRPDEESRAGQTDTREIRCDRHALSTSDLRAAEKVVAYEEPTKHSDILELVVSATFSGPRWEENVISEIEHLARGARLVFWSGDHEYGEGKEAIRAAVQLMHRKVAALSALIDRRDVEEQENG